MWSNAEESLFRVMIKCFPGNFCAVAELMASKSCREVFRFSRLEGKTARVRRPNRNNGAKVRLTETHMTSVSVAADSVVEPFHFDPAPASHDGGSGSSSVPVKHNLLL